MAFNKKGQIFLAQFHPRQTMFIILDTLRVYLTFLEIVPYHSVIGAIIWVHKPRGQLRGGGSLSLFSKSDHEGGKKYPKI